MRAPIALCLLLPLLAGCATVSQVATRMAAAQPAPDAFSDKTQEDLYLGIIDGLIKQGRYEAALAFLDQYRTPSPRSLVLRGDALVGAGYPLEAIPAYKAATQSAYGAQAYNGMGRAESAHGAWAAAIEDFRRASAIEPANAEYLNNLGYARLQLKAQGSLAVATEDLKRAHELDPDSAAIRNNLILASYMANDHARMQGLLDTISDSGQRAAVKTFVNSWPGGGQPGATDGGDK